MAVITYENRRDASAAASTSTIDLEPNFGPSDLHAIRAIFALMVSIFLAALVMYGTIALWAG